MKLRNLLPYGYKAYNGQVLPDCHVDSYNAIQERINAFIKSGQRVPEYLTLGSFNLFSTYPS